MFQVPLLRLLSSMVGDLMFSPEHPLDFHAAIGSVSPAGIVKVLEIG